MPRSPFPCAAERAWSREADGGDARCETADYENAFNLIREWMSKRRVQRLAGLDDGVFLRSRRRLFARMQLLAASSSPHARIKKAELAARIRRAATATLGVEEEREMMAIDQLDTGYSENWFNNTGAREKWISSSESEEFRIRALLLLVAPAPHQGGGEGASS